MYVCKTNAERNDVNKVPVSSEDVATGYRATVTGDPSKVDCR